MTNIILYIILNQRNVFQEKRKTMASLGNQLALEKKIVHMYHNLIFGIYELDINKNINSIFTSLCYQVQYIYQPFSQLTFGKYA